MKLETITPINKWEKLFTDIILSRGADYCRKKVVENLRQDDAQIDADVVGSETYHVHIDLEDGGISALACDCPYAADGLKNCKHMAAVLFAALAPDKASKFKTAKKPAKPLSPPKPNCTQVTIRIEDEDTIAQRYCAIPEVKVGDYVVFLLNERETIGLVEEVNQMPRPIDAYGLGRRNHVLRITEKPEPISPFTIRILPPTPLCRLTLASKNEMRRMIAKRTRLEKHNIKIGDILILDTDDAEEAVILDIDDMATDDLPYCQFIAVRENKDFTELLRNKVTLHIPDDGESNAEFVLHNWTSEVEEARIPFGVDRVAAFAFEDNWDVRRVVITGPYVHLDSFAFSHNESIEEIAIENDYAYCVPASFEGCECLRKISLPYTCYHMRKELERKFPGVSIEFLLNGNVNVNGIIYSADMTKVVCCTNHDIAIYYSPTSVTTIYPRAFSDCSLMKRFLLTPYVTDRGRACLANCFSLEEIAVNYDDEIEVVLMFGQDFSPNAKEVILHKKDGSEVQFYLPSKCKFTKLPKAKEALREIKIEELEPERAYALGKHFEEEHSMKEAVACYIRAYQGGQSQAYEKLTVLVQNEYYREYFDLNTYDDVMRTRSIEPALHHFALTIPGQKWSGFTVEQLMEKFQKPEELNAFLADLAQADLLHGGLLNNLLKRLYPRFGRKAALETKVLFYRCARKLSDDDCTLNWREDLLAELLLQPAYQREFLFDRIKTFYLERDLTHENLIAGLVDEELRMDVMSAYEAGINPQSANVELCQSFLKKAEATHDEIYQWCALLAVSTYIAQCWRNKNSILLRSILQIAIEACQSGMYLMGIPILHYRQNLKRNIPRSFYRTIAQCLQVKGLLSFNDYENLLGDYRAKYIDYFYRYADLFDLDTPDAAMMKYVRQSWFCTPGIELKDEEAKESIEKRPYESFVPLKTGDDLVVFSNPHEAVSYMIQNNLPVVDYYFSIPYKQILTIMDMMKVDEAILMPLCLNKRVTKQYVEDTRRSKS